MVSNINVHIDDSDYEKLMLFKTENKLTWTDLLLFHIGKRKGDGRTTRHKKSE